MAQRDEIQALVNDPEIKPLLIEQRHIPQADGTDRVVEAPRNFMRARLRTERDAEAVELETVLADPYARKRITNPDVLKRRLTSSRRDIVQQQPPMTTPSQRSKVFALMKACEAVIATGMPSKQEMRRNADRASSVGVADRAKRWDRAQKGNVLLWKSARQILDPENDDRDYLNVEQLRPEGLHQAVGLDAEIPQVFALSAQAKANYDAIDWKNPEVQAEIAARLAEARVKVTTGVRRGALRPPGNYKVYAAPDGKTFTGPFGAPNYKRYLKRLDMQKHAEGAIA